MDGLVGVGKRKVYMYFSIRVRPIIDNFGIDAGFAVSSFDAVKDMIETRSLNTQPRNGSA